MSEPIDRFIDAAVRPLAGNPELQIGAGHQLAEAHRGGKILEPAALESATTRLETTPLPSRPPAWKLALFAVTILASVICLGLGGRSALHVRQFFNHVSPMTPWGSGSYGDGGSALVRGLTPEQRLLLLGDTSRSSTSDRFVALRDSEPENSAYLADHAIRLLQDRDQLPPDFLATAEKIDPDNA